eukprot:76099-Chlamydomonas_euryale.AAC.1
MELQQGTSSNECVNHVSPQLQKLGFKMKPHSLNGEWGRSEDGVCALTTLDSSASASQMDQTGSTRSYPTSTTA